MREILHRFKACANVTGMHIILDFIPNHTSDQHPWFLESRDSSDRTNTKRSYYVWEDGAAGSPPNNWVRTVILLRRALGKRIFVLCGQRRPGSDCASAQSDPGLCCPLAESLYTETYYLYVAETFISYCGFVSWSRALLFPLTLRPPFLIARLSLFCNAIRTRNSLFFLEIHFLTRNSLFLLETHFFNSKLIF